MKVLWAVLVAALLAGMEAGLPLLPLGPIQVLNALFCDPASLRARPRSEASLTLTGSERLLYALWCVFPSVKWARAVLLGR